MVLFLTAFLFSSIALAQSFPTKPVKIVVPYPPGGGNDIMARFIQPKLADEWRQPVVVENKPGAAGNLGAGEVARAPADGYTLLMATSTIAMTPGLGQKVSYELEKDLTAVAMVGATAMVIAVNPTLEAKTLPQLLSLARAQPGKLAYSTCGNASPMHLAGELLKLTAKVDLVHVPYKGCAPALADVIGGQLPIAFNTISNAAPFEKSGKVRILALVSAKRSSEFPNLPTAAEQGMSGYEADIWFGLFAPAATPRSIVSSINGAVNKALADPEVQGRMRSQYYDARPSSPDEFAAFVKSEVVKWGRTIRDANIKAD
ncbi:MAG TPA: tripartite tricarboxylate transporter substrate binding protein [Burkholderiales bacterium]|nr:tripartite tricarboxylate transporter substrate binding protein [Burkholderiales bacterium]